MCTYSAIITLRGLVNVSEHVSFPFLILPWIFWQLPGLLVSAAHLSPLASRLSQLWHDKSFVGFVWCSYGDLCRWFLSCVVWERFVASQAVFPKWNVCKVVFAKEQIFIYPCSFYILEDKGLYRFPDKIERISPEMIQEIHSSLNRFEVRCGPCHLTC